MGPGSIIISIVIRSNSSRLGQMTQTGTDVIATNKIDPTVVIRGDVDMGVGNEILPYTVLIGPLNIGDDNYIGPHVTIGTPGQDTRNPRYDSSECRIEIGSGNIIREYTAIQKPCYRDITRIGNNCYLMQSVHIPHDAIIDDDVVITPMVVMGGITHIMTGANLGLSCSIHQYSVIGAYSMVAMGTATTKNVRPFSVYVPGKPPRVNRYAIKKYGFDDHSDEIKNYVMSGARPNSSTVSEIVDRFDSAHLASKRELY